MTIRTRICDLLGIEHPIIQGGMAWVATAELAAAVSEAGGLGVIGAGQMPTEILVTEIEKCQALTDRPFGVNLMLLTPHIDELVDVCLSHRVPVVTTGAGNPGPYMDRFKSIGTKVLPVVASVALARRLERVGADAIIGEGMEAGGHIGDITTMVLIPQLVDVCTVPVIAAGGIADGRGMAAAFALGAAGVQVGTRFMCATECTVHESIKDVILSARDRDTVITGRCTGHPVRIIKNRLARELEELDAKGSPAELEERGTGTLRLAMRDGDIEGGSVMSGQCAAMVDEITPAAEIISEMVRVAEETMRSLSKRLGDAGGA
jgi:enoyl-[acyl-carrier protein] reductase II